jgi:hypothetical protein
MKTGRENGFTGDQMNLPPPAAKIFPPKSDGD